MTLDSLAQLRTVVLIGRNRGGLAAVQGPAQLDKDEVDRVPAAALAPLLSGLHHPRTVAAGHAERHPLRLAVPQALPSNTSTLDRLAVGPTFMRPACRYSSSCRSISAAGPRQTSAANPPTAAAAVDRWDRLTDRRTDIRPFYNAYSILRGPRNNSSKLWNALLIELKKTKLSFIHTLKESLPQPLR